MGGDRHRTRHRSQSPECDRVPSVRVRPPLGAAFVKAAIAGFAPRLRPQQAKLAPNGAP